ncbi:MAG: hypothetical protein IJ188_07440 [Clostridia bacterium]|nr:hypothetical protein [Clostridia bacterium]
MLTQEKADIITKYLGDNEDIRNKLFDLEPLEATKELNAAGIDCTVQELVEYGKALEMALAQDELSPEQLESVAGGTAGATVIIAGVTIAWLVAKMKWKW